MVMKRRSKPLQYIRSRGFAPRVAITLGSGLDEVVGRLHTQVQIPYKLIPHFPGTTVQGHGGTLHLGTWKGVPVAILEGRVHCYEGHAPATVVFPVRALALAGVETFILTCAAGGIASKSKPGGFMVFSDHLHLQGVNPLVGVHDPRWGAQFVDLTEAYDPRLRRITRKAASKLRVPCFEGVYASLLGPTYETPAEIRALKGMGADAVGMSTVPEVMAARQLKCRVLAIATISNRAAGLAGKPLSHEEVLAAGRAASRHLADLLDAVLPQLGEGSGEAMNPGRTHRARRGSAGERLRRLLPLQSGGGIAGLERQGLHGVQRRELHLRPDGMRRARRPVEGPLGGRKEVHANCCRDFQRAACLTLRRLPATPLGILWRHRSHSRQPARLPENPAARGNLSPSV